LTRRHPDDRFAAPVRGAVTAPLPVEHAEPTSEREPEPVAGS
jgi:hypothetical protein